MATVKRVCMLNNEIALEPDSDDPACRPLVLDRAEGGGASASVIGCIVWFCPPVEWGMAG